jgi:hypothetical protein
VALDGEFYWSDDDEEVQPVQELEIVIKKWGNKYVTN